MVLPDTDVRRRSNVQYVKNAVSLTFQKTGSTVEVEMQVLNFAVIRELLVNIILLGLFIDAGDDQDPAFHRSGINIGVPLILNPRIPHPVES